MMLRLGPWLFLGLGLLSCANRTATADLLALNFAGTTALKITPIQPTEGARYLSPATTFDWSSPVSTAYMLEIAADAKFTALILQKRLQGTTYTWQAADNLNGTAIKSGTYYWRVKSAEISSIAMTETRSFFIFLAGTTPGGEVLYVNNASASSIQNGGFAYPYKSIANAVPLANALRNSNPANPLRIVVAKGDYVESVSMLAGISLYAGYDANKSGADDIAWDRDVSRNTTTIQAPTDIAMSFGSDITPTYTASTILDGFVVRGGSVGESVALNLANAQPTITNNTLFAGGGATRRYAVSLTNGGGIIRANTIYGATASGSPVNIFRFTNGGGVIIERNTIIAETASGLAPSSSYVVFCNVSCIPIFRNNIILGGNANNTWFQNLGGSFMNNSIYFSSNASTILNGSNLTLENNVIITTGGTCNSGTFLSNQNNNCFPTAMAGGTGNTNISNVFVSLSGPDANLYTTADNDWRLATAGTCNVRAGGLNQSATFTTDFLGVTRTAVNHCGAGNAGAAGWSMGAYESD